MKTRAPTPEPPIDGPYVYRRKIPTVNSPYPPADVVDGRYSTF